MDVESAIFNQDSELNKKSDGHNHNHTNGMSNGYSGDNKHHKSSHKDKHRDKDRDHKKDHKTSSSKDKERDRERDRDKHSSSKDKERSKDKDSSKSSRDKDREKDRSDKDREKSRDKHHHDEKKSSSSSSKHHKSEKSSKDSSKSKDYISKSSSSTSDKHKHSSSSSKDKHSSSSSKDKERSRSEKDKHHSSSSSSRDKDRKDRDKEREKSRSDKSKSNHNNSNNHYRENSESKREEKFYQKDEIKNEDEYIKQENDYASPDQVDEANASSASSSFYNLSAFDSSQRQDDYCDNNEDTKDDASIKQEQDDDYLSDDQLPLSARTSLKRKVIESDDDDDDVPLLARKKVKSEKKKSKKRQNEEKYNNDYEEKPKITKVKKEVKQEPESGSPKKRKKKEEAEPEVWKWWEEEKKDDGTKWNFLEHKGPVFAPPYEPLPDNVRFFYDNKEMKLSQDAEEVAGFYARMLDHDYTTKDIFNNNFFKDWRKVMTEKERSKITDLRKCNFKEMHAFFMDQSERNRNRTKEEKEELKKKNAAIQEEYGFCTIDGHKEKIGNFKIEPPGLFRGRGEHPKMGMLKKRVMPEDVLINCSKKSKIPEPPPGHKWKEVRHDSSVTWLASWTENVQNQVKYVMLNPSSKLKGEKDWQKYETARKLAKSIDKIRKEYREDWKSKEMRIRQRAVALYFIDKLALRAGNEKDEDQADTVGCCSLRVEHIDLHEEKDGKEYVVVFDFLGKDSIRYYNEVPVEKRVFKNLQLFMENKSPSDDLFDRLNTAVLNKHLNELMEGLTAKCFRTYNASWTLQQQLEELTNPDDSVAEKILSYNRANRAVAILCNHQRSVPKGHAKSMEKLKEKIQQKREQIDDAEMQVKDAKRAAKSGSVKEQVNYDKKKKMLDRLRDQLKKLEVQETDRDENKAIALGTSKLNYLDPRISVAWCKKFDVPIEKIYNKTQRDKFRWAIDMAGADYVF